MVKGQTAASSYKPAILENGVKVLVPPFIEVGHADRRRHRRRHLRRAGKGLGIGPRPAAAAMNYRSPLLNVMTGAALKAAKGLIRDFGELEQLQVSKKGPADFVSRADHKSESVLRAELKKARPAYGLLMEESGDPAGTRYLQSLGHRSARRHHQLSARHPAFFDFDRASSATASPMPASSIRRSPTRCSWRSAAAAPFLMAAGFASPVAATSRRRCSPPASRSSGSADHGLFLKQLGAVMAVCTGVRRYRLGGARSRLGRRRPLRRLLGERLASLGHYRRNRAGARGGRLRQRPVGWPQDVLRRRRARQQHGVA